MAIDIVGSERQTETAPSGRNRLRFGAMPAGRLAAIREEQKSAWTCEPDCGPCSVIGGGSSTPERAAFYNGALIRQLDFMDAFIAREERCHPSDNIGALLAAAELAKASARDFLTAMAIAYHVQCRRLAKSSVSDA